MNIGVFCSANGQIDPDFFRATEELGRWLAASGHTLVYGGVNQGLMESIARAVSEGGGRVVGVVPRIVETSGRTSQYVEVEIRCDDLTDRKQLMMDHSDLFVALPGGIGTLDEVFTVAASATIGYHQKPVILLNVKDFWRPLITLLDDLQQRGMVRGQWQQYIKVASTVEELTTLLDFRSPACPTDGRRQRRSLSPRRGPCCHK